MSESFESVKRIRQFLEKHVHGYLLTCSAEAYCEMIGRALYHFTPRSVDSIGVGDSLEGAILRAKAGLIKQASLLEAQVVGNLLGQSGTRPNNSALEFYLFGTALIPKERLYR